MNSTEFFQEFNLLYNNIDSGIAPGLSKYEISVLLTNAQEELIKDYYNPKSNSKQEGIESSFKRDSDFSTLIFTKVTNKTTDYSSDLNAFSTNSAFYSSPEDLFIPLGYKLAEYTSSGAIVSTTKPYIVIPISTEEYLRLQQKPYNKPFKGTVWLLNTYNNYYYGTTQIPDTPKLIYEITPNLTPTVLTNRWKLLVRYVRHPYPIILEQLNEATYGQVLTINGKSNPWGYKSEALDTTWEVCELPVELHREILNRAVEKAKVAYTVDNAEATIQTNQRQE